MRKARCLLCMGGILSGLLLGSANASFAEDLIVKSGEEKSDDGLERVDEDGFFITYTDLNVDVQENGYLYPKHYIFLSGEKAMLNWAGTIDFSQSQGPLVYACQTDSAKINIHDGASLVGVMAVRPDTFGNDKNLYHFFENDSTSLNIKNSNNLTLSGENEKVNLYIDYRFDGLDMSQGPAEVKVVPVSDPNESVWAGFSIVRAQATSSDDNTWEFVTDDDTEPIEHIKSLQKRLNVVVKNDYLDDGRLNPQYVYKVHIDYQNDGMLIEHYDDYGDGTYQFQWRITGVTLTNTGSATEAVKSAADNQRALFNLWRLNDSHVFHRGEALRIGRTGSAWRDSAPQTSEGVWANVYRGKYHFDSPYGRKVKQNYTSAFIGFDKVNEGDFHDGTLYRGVFADIGASDASYPTGKGELESKGLGAYVSWQGNKGHFLDAALRVDKLTNEYTYVDTGGTSGKNKYNTWAWGVSGQYGYHKDWGSGAYIEPLVGLSYGRMNSTSYTLHNSLAFDQKGGDFLVGRAGLRFGKVFGAAGRGTNLYGKLMLSHEFLDAAEAETTFGGNVLHVKPIAEKDTWTDVTLGVSKAFGKRGNGYVEFTRSIGGDVRSDWQVAAGLSFYWDPEPKYHGGPREETNAQFFTAANSAGASTVLTPNAAAAPAGSGSMTEIAAVASVETAGAAAEAETYSETAVQTNAAEAAAPDYGTTAFSRAGTYGSVRDGVYELAPVTVESDRPVWEKTLSPGTVSVVYPEAYKGEMKTVPDMLDAVAGVFVQRISGTGHYTLARVRGSTGQQVNVYVDGVLMNSSGETGVDLSQLPTEQIERIEVYKGYIPARFAGAAIGGAINIVTKKPEGATGSVSMGMRSFGGYTGNLSMTTPAGDGTLLVQLNRDQMDGDFGYNWYPFKSSYDAWYENLTARGDGPITPYGGRVWRHNNWYRTTDALVKWQDDHWLVKAQYVEKNEGSAPSADSVYADNLYKSIDGSISAGGYERFFSQKNKNTDILIGRRQQTGNLEWGAYLNYGVHRKINDYHGPMSDYTNPGINSEYKHTFWGARLDGNWKINDSNMLEFLFSYSDETMKVVRANAWGTWEDMDTANYSRVFLPKYDIKHYYFQLQDSMALDRRKTLIFTPEWRAEKFDTTAFDHGKGNYNNSKPTDPTEKAWKYSYGLGLKKYISDNWTVHGSYGTYYRAPNFYEMFGDGGVFVRAHPTGDPNYAGGDVTWEEGSQYDIGTDWKGRTFGADTNLSLTYFNRHVKNMASPIYGFDGTMYYTNLGEGKIDGVELEADWSWKNWELSQSVTWNHSLMEKVDNTAAKEEALDIRDRNLAFPWTPKWETNTRLSYLFHNREMSAFAEYHYTASMLTYVDKTTTNPTTYASLGTFNLGVKYKPGAWQFTAGVNDLFNRAPKQRLHSQEYGDKIVFYPGQGRTYYFTAKYSF